MVQRLGLAGHKSASYSLLAQPVSKALHFVLESADSQSSVHQPLSAPAPPPKAGGVAGGRRPHSRLPQSRRPNHRIDAATVATPPKPPATRAGERLPRRPTCAVLPCATDTVRHKKLKTAASGIAFLEPQAHRNGCAQCRLVTHIQLLLRSHMCRTC